MEYRRLCPTWHSLCLNYGLRKKAPFVIVEMECIPEFGGFGVDVNVRNGQLEIFCPKTGKCKSHFYAEKYALPLLPPVHLRKSLEPCLEELKSIEYQQKHFFLKLNNKLRARKRKRKLYKEMSNIHDKIVYCMKNGITEDIQMSKYVYETSKYCPVDNFPAPVANFTYVGGSLDYLSLLDGSFLLLHPGGGNINELFATRIDLQKKCLNKSRSEFRLISQDSIRLSGGLIYQIDAKTIADQGFCCVRKLNSCHILSVDRDNPNIRTEKLGKFNFSEQISCARLSPYIPGECLMTTVSGQIHLYSAYSKNPLWETQHSLWEGYRWNADFSSAPRLMSILDRNQLAQTDLRSKPYKPLTIFTSTNQHLFEKEELIFSLKHPQQHCQCFLATTHHFLLCDHRYPNRPVQIFNHMLTTLPIHSSSVLLNNSKEILVFLGAQESREVCCFHLQSSNVVQPVSFSPPWYLSTPADFGEALKLQGVLVPTDRLLAPLTGCCAVPNPNAGFTAFQVTSLGDLFYQDFFVKPPVREKTFRFGPGCKLLPQAEILCHVHEWLDDDFGKDRMPKYNQSTKGEKCFRARKNLLRRKCPSAECCICVPKDGYGRKGKVCPSCGLHTKASFLLTAAKQEGSVLVGRPHGFEACEDEVKKFKFVPPQTMDKLSKKIFQVWIGDEKTMDTDDSGGKNEDNMDEGATVLQSFLMPSAARRVSKPDATEQEDDDIEIVFSAKHKRRTLDSSGF